jgi:dTDP-4-amino-4,6-dideoxygalactose transaminase
MTALGLEYQSLKEEIDEAIHSVLISGRYVLEEQLAQFESEFAAFVGTRHAIGVGSGSDALTIALISCKLGPADEVITAPNTDNPTASAIIHGGARVVFADVDASSFTLDPSEVEKAVTKRTRALLPVHLFGHPAEMASIQDLADHHDLIVIEDAALAVGACYRGRRVGSFGLVGCFSLAPSKILGGYGDGGVLVTDDDEIANRARVLRNYGHAEGTVLDPSDMLGGSRWSVTEHGFNSRLDTLQAAVLRVKLRSLEERIAARRQAASAYDELLADAPVAPPGVAEDVEHTFFAYNILSNGRDQLRASLAAEGVATRLYYNPPLHLQPAFRGLGYLPGAFPVAERASEKMLALPIFPQITRAQIEWVASAVMRAWDRAATK